MKQQKGVEKRIGQKNDKTDEGLRKADRKSFKERHPLKMGVSSKHVQDIKCPNQKKCGGCQYLHLTNEGQLAIKQKKAE